MKSKSVIEKTFFSLLPVHIIMIIVSSINSIIDEAIAANFVGATSLAIIALFMPVIKGIDTINTVFLGGSQILCGQYIGKNQLKKSICVFSTDFFSIFIIGLAATVAGCCFSRPVAAIFVRDEALIQGLSGYIFGYSFGFLPSMFIPQLTAFLQIEHREKRTYFGMGIMIFLNITLDILFVTVCNLGMFGLGLATSLSYFAFFLVLVSYYFVGKPSLFFDIKQVCFKNLRDIVQVGFSGAVSQLSQTVRSALLNMILLTFVGNDGMSAFSAVYSFGCVFYATTGGISNAVRVLASIYVGEEDRAGLKAIMKTAVRKGTALILTVSAVCMLCAPVFTRMFYGPAEGPVYNMTLMGFIIFPLTMPFSCICCTFGNYYQCLKRMGIVNILMFVDGLLGVVVFCYALVPLLGMNGIWIAHVFSGIFTLVVILIYTIVFNKRWPKSRDDFLTLSDDFGVLPENMLDIEITDMENVINLSKTVVGFSKNHGVDRRRANIAGLCIEELAGNIVKHGFDGKKDYSIDVRIVYRQDELLIRLRDNCRAFNPTEFVEMFSPEDISHNIGLRMVSKTSKSMSYNNCLRTNVLTIII